MRVIAFTSLDRLLGRLRMKSNPCFAEHQRGLAQSDVRDCTSDLVEGQNKASAGDADLQFPEGFVSAVEKRLDVVLERLLTPILAKVEKKLTMPVQEWFSIQETAILTGLSSDHVRRHVTSGLLPVSNQGTHEKPYYRIHRKDIDEWMNKRREMPLPTRRHKKDAASSSYVSRHHQ